MTLLLFLIVFVASLVSFESFNLYSLKSYRKSIPFALNTAVSDALASLDRYNTEYLQRIKSGKKAGKSPELVEYERTQMLKQDGVREERLKLGDSIRTVTEASKEVVLGIMATRGSAAISCLKAWVQILGLPRGVIRAIDNSDKGIEVCDLNDAPVYLKYNSSEGGDCYMKPYSGEFSGVLFQPVLDDNEFRQFGDFHLKIF